MKKCNKCFHEAQDKAKFCPECGENLLSYPKPAGFWIRVLASIIDSLVFIPVILLGLYILISVKSHILFLIIAIPGMLYKPFMESYYGATLGKMALGIKVIDENGNNLTLSNAYLRFMPFMIPSLITVAGSFFLFSSPEFQAAETFIEIGKAKQNIDNGIINGLKMFTEIIVWVDCLFVPFTFRKRAFHDIMANSFCIYKTQEQPVATISVGANNELTNGKIHSSYCCHSCKGKIPFGATECPECGWSFRNEK